MNSDAALRALTVGALSLAALSSAEVSAIQVTLNVDNGAACTASPTRNVVLSNTVTGATPNHYRASESKSDISSAAWQTYSASPVFALSSGGGQKIVYFQVRGTENGATVDSAIVGDPIELVVPTGTVTLSINGGSSSTTNRTVTLNNTVTLNPVGANTRYIASENADFTGAAWQSYSAAPSFQLSDGTGTKTVHMIVSREICGTVAGTRASDTINYVLEAVAVSPVAETIRHTFVLPTSFAGDVNTPTDVIRYAESRGFGHTETRTAGQGVCQRILTPAHIWRSYEDELFLAARAVAKTKPPPVRVYPITCDFMLFSGRQLNTGWRVVRLVAKTYITEPWSGLATIFKSPSGTDMSTGIRVYVPGGEVPRTRYAGDLTLNDYVDGDFWGNAAEIQEIVIEGPTKEWRDAFR